MKVGAIIKSNQPDMHNQLKKKSIIHRGKKKKSKNESLSFHDIEQLMKHDSYARGKGGAIRQVKHE